MGRSKSELKGMSLDDFQNRANKGGVSAPIGIESATEPIMDKSVGADRLHGKELEEEKERRRQELLKQVEAEVLTLISPQKKEEAKRKAFKGENRDVKFDEAMAKLSTAFLSMTKESRYPELLKKKEILQEAITHFFRDEQNIRHAVNKTFSKIITSAAEKAFEEIGKKPGAEVLPATAAEKPLESGTPNVVKDKKSKEIWRKYEKNNEYVNKAGDRLNIVSGSYIPGKDEIEIAITKKGETGFKKRRLTIPDLEKLLQDEFGQSKPKLTPETGQEKNKATKAEAMLADIADKKEVTIKKIESGVFKGILYAQKFYLFQHPEIIGEVKKLPKEDERRVREARDLANLEIAEAIKKHNEKVEKEKKAVPEPTKKEPAIKVEQTPPIVSKDPNLPPNLPPQNPEEAKARKEKIEQLQKEADDLRAAFAGEDYRANNLLSKIKGILGVKMSSENVDSVNFRYTDYRAKLSELLREQLDDLKSQNLSGEDLKRKMGELINSHDPEEKIKLYEARTNARAEARKGKLGETILQKSGDAINWYRKLPPKYKYAVAATMFVGGGGLAAIASFAGVGAAGLGVLGTNIFAGSSTGAAALMGYRAISGAATGVGTTAWLEARYRGKERETAERSKTEILEEMEKAGNNLDIVMQKLGEIDYKESLKMEQARARNRRIAGAAVGITIGSASYIMGKTGASRWIAEKLGFAPTNAMPPKAGAEAAHGIDLEKLKDGGNIQASIRDYYRSHPDLIEKYNHLHGGGRKFNAGQIAERLWHESGMNKDLVHAGAQVHLSPDGMHLVSVTGDDHMGYLHHETPSAENVMPDSAAPADNAVSAGSSPEVPENPESVSGEYAMDPGRAAEINWMDAKVSDLRTEISNIDSQMNHIEMGSYPTDDFPGRPGQLQELIDKKQFLEKSAADLIAARDKSYSISIMKYVSGNSQDNWAKIKDLPMRQLIEDKKGSVYKLFSTVSRESVKNFKGNINPKSGETLIKWVARIVKLKRI